MYYKVRPSLSTRLDYIVPLLLKCPVYLLTPVLFFSTSCALLNHFCCRQGTPLQGPREGGLTAAATAAGLSLEVVSCESESSDNEGGGGGGIDGGQMPNGDVTG